MGNALKRELKAGDKVVMEDGREATVIEPLGFGALPFTMGTAQMVEIGGERVRCNAEHDIDAEATMNRFGVDNDWVAQQDPDVDLGVR